MDKLTIVMLDLLLLARLLNVFVTVICGLFLFKVYLDWKCKNHFHLLWGLGFVFYGVQIFLRLKLPLLDIFVVILFFSSLLLWFCGIGLAMQMLRRFLIVMTIAILVTAIYTLSFRGGLIIGVIPYSMVIAGVILLRRKYGKVLNLLLLGWILLLTTNILFGLVLLPEYFIDFFAVISKLVIVYGATSPMFPAVGMRVEEFLRKSSEKPVVERTHIALVKCTGSSRLKELSWIKQSVLENSKKGIKTILIILYDLISPLELKDLGLLDHEDVYIVRVLRDVRQETDLKKLTTIRDDLTSLGVLFSKIVKYARENSVNCNIILYSLSWLIRSHGWRSVYMLTTQKIPDLKNSPVCLQAFCYPDIHKNKTALSLFERMAEETIIL